MSKTHSANHLVNETSPYLQQHAHNPVDWYPWGSEALEKARKENKPILLSIGYAACHWCHVMAHESFEDEETAELMNRLFVNIKVDREERPDLDKVYQATHYLLTQQSGGWPLTVFLTPDNHTPFFSGTYFPLEARYQLPGFKDVLQAIANSYRDRQPEIKKQNIQLLEILNPRLPDISDVHLNQQPLQHALRVLQRNYDAINGGFGASPKFPQPSKLAFLFLQDSPLTKNTLEHMASGGINDQLSGGFYRYSVDGQWRIPHFEKMLYDNAQLLHLYTVSYKKYQEPLFAENARNIADWVINTMQSPQGGYYSSIDADSEGHEGKYYVWTKDAVAGLLTKEEFSVFELHYGLNHAANFEDSWHLYIAESLENVANQLKMPLENVRQLISSSKKKLLTARSNRIPPALDTKILTAWNALMIKSMLTAGEILEEPRYMHSARKSLAFIKTTLWKNHRLLATNRDTNNILPAYLDDYAFLLDGLLTSLQISWNTDDLLFAMELADKLIKHFSDENAGGFYFTANDHEQLLYRPKSMMDEAIPAGNAIAAHTLLIFGHLLGETRYIQAAEKTLHSSWPILTQHPAEHSGLLIALKEFLEPPQIIVIRGDNSEIKNWLNVSKKLNNYVFAIPNQETDLPGLIALKKPQDKTCAYICQGTQCLNVIEDKNKFLSFIIH